MPFDGFSPTNLTELQEIVRRNPEGVRYIAGGTDFLIALENGRLDPDCVVDLSRLEELSYIHMEENEIRIGAATPLSDLCGHTALGAALPVLVQAAGQVGSVQIRNRATLGGNIASAVPGGDMLPVLSCLDARVKILDVQGTVYHACLDEILLDIGKTSLADGSLILEVSIARRDSCRSAFRKLGRRSVLTIARLNLAGLADYDPDTNRIRSISLAAGALGPRPLRLAEIEKSLAGRSVDGDLIADFKAMLTRSVDAAIPGRYSQSYKRQAVIGLGLDLLEGLFGAELEGMEEWN